MFFHIKESLLYALLPMGAALLGSLFAYLSSPRPQIIAFFFHIAAGIILSTAAYELLPQLMNNQEKLTIALSFLAGALTMIFLHILFFQLEKFSVLSMVLSLSCALLLDGIMIGIGFYLSEKTGIMLSYSLCLLVLFLNFVVMHTVRQRAWKKIMQFFTVFFVAFMLPIGSWLGTYLLTIQPFTKIEITSYLTALFLYLGFHEILRLSRSPREGWLHALALFLGMLFPVILM